MEAKPARLNVPPQRLRRRQDEARAGVGAWALRREQALRPRLVLGTARVAITSRLNNVANARARTPRASPRRAPRRVPRRPAPSRLSHLKLLPEFEALLDPDLATDDPVERALERRPVQPLHALHVPRRQGFRQRGHGGAPHEKPFKSISRSEGIKLLLEITGVSLCDFSSINIHFVTPESSVGSEHPESIKLL